MVLAEVSEKPAVPEPVPVLVDEGGTVAEFLLVRGGEGGEVELDQEHKDEVVFDK